MIKLIASDLDGTIIDNKHSIPQGNLKAINDLQKANIPFVICTGKTYSVSKEICKNLNASFGIFGNLFPNQIKFEIVDSVLDYIKKQNCTVFKLIVSSSSNLSPIKEELMSTTNLTVTHITKTGKYKDKIIDKEYEYLDISPLNVTKGKALEILSQYLELSKEDILSIGFAEVIYKFIPFNT